MARPPKPIEQHIQEGTYRKDRHEGALVVTTPGTGIAYLGAPDHLTTMQQAVWMEIAGWLDFVVRESDAPMVEIAAVSYSMYREAQDLVQAEGLTVTDDRGNTREHPAVKIAQRYMKMYMDTSARLGLSPADRARLGLNLGALAKTASQLMEEQYGEDGDSEAGELIEVHDAGMEADVLREAELGYDDRDEPGN